MDADDGEWDKIWDVSNGIQYGCVQYVWLWGVSVSGDTQSIDKCHSMDGVYCGVMGEYGCGSGMVCGCGWCEYVSVVGVGSGYGVVVLLWVL